VTSINRMKLTISFASLNKENCYRLAMKLAILFPETTTMLLFLHSPASFGNTQSKNVSQREHDKLLMYQLKAQKEPSATNTNSISMIEQQFHHNLMGIYINYPTI